MIKILIHTVIATFITSIIAVMTFYFLDVNLNFKSFILSLSIFFIIFFCGEGLRYQYQIKKQTQT